MSDLPYWLAFNRLGLGAVRVRALEHAFGTLERAWRAPVDRLRAAGFDERLAARVAAQRAVVDPTAEMERAQRLGLRVLTWHDDAYPRRLKEAPDPPPVLYLRGDPAWDDDRCIAIVGTRSPTQYGVEAARTLAADLARCGLTIVSGLARGIDAVAHRAAVEASGRTVAVLGSGLDVIYPPEHAELAAAIARHGAVVSELPPGTRPSAQFFPRRNRLLSGMSRAVLVVEAGETSGALWTVRHALEQDRDVMCVPGSIFSPASRATNRLIQDGAKLVLDYRDILEELGLAPSARGARQAPLLEPVTPAAAPPSAGAPAPPPPAADSAPPDSIEEVVLAQLSSAPVHVDEVRRLTNLPIATVSSTLALLELKGLVRQVGAMNYVRTREAPARNAR